METIKQIIRTPKNHKIRIKIPLYIPENDLVEVQLILRKSPEDYHRKIDELKAAMNDELFLSELREVANEFENIDIEEWAE